MENIATLQAIVTADTSRFEQAMADVQRSGSQSMNFLSGIGDLGKSLTLGLTVPLLGAGAAISKIGMDFDAEMRNINSLLLLNEEGFQALGTEVNQFASDSIYGANATADALYTIVSAGIGVKDTAEAMTLLGTATKVAASGRDDLDRTTMAIIAMYENFKKAGYTSEHIGDVIANMVQKGAGELSTYTTNMAKIGPAASALGIDFEELGSDVAQLSLTYGNGSKPMTAMGMAMSNLLRPNLTLQAAFQELGVVTGKELIGKFGGLNEALFALKGHMSEIDFSKAFSKTGSEAVLLLTNDIDKTRGALLEFQNTVDGAAARALAQQMMSAEAAFNKAKSAMEGVAVVLSNTLLPMIAPVFNAVADLGNAFIHADPAIQQIVVALGLVATAIGPVLWAFSFIVGSLSPIGLAFKGAALAAVAFATDFGGIATSIKKTVEEAITALKPLTDALDGFFDELFPEAPSDYKGLVDLGKNIMAGLDGVTLGDPAERLKVEKPSSLWDIYVKQGYDKQFDWNTFVAKVTEGGWAGGQINPGDIIHIGDPDDVVGQIGTVGDTIRSAWDDVVGWANVKEKTDWNFGDAINVVTEELPFIDRLITAAQNAWPAIQTALADLWTKVTGWFDSTVGAGVDFLAGLFTGSTATGGETPIYAAVKALLDGDIYKAIDSVIPGAGDHLKGLIGGDWGAKIGDAFPQIRDGLANLAVQFSAWFQNEAIPTVARSIGYFMGRIGGMLYGGFKDVIQGIGKGPGAGDVGSALSGFGESVMTPFSSGLQEGLASTGEVDMSDTFSGFAQQLVGALAGAIGLASLAAGAWGLATGGIFAGLKAALVVPTWFAGNMLTVAGKIAGSIASGVATQLGIEATWTGFAGAVAKGIGAVPAFVASGITWFSSAATAMANQIFTYLGVSTAWTGMAGAISKGLQAVGVIALTIADFAFTVAGAIAQPILAQLGVTATWSTVSTVIGGAINRTTISAFGSTIMSYASNLAGAIAAPILAQLGLSASWATITAMIGTGISAVAAPVMLTLTNAAAWATAIAAPLVAAVGSAAAWAGITGSLWLAAAPIIAIGVAVAGVIAALNNYNKTTEAGVITAQMSVKVSTDAGLLTEKEIDDQVFASIQSSPLGDIGARLFYTNFKAQVMGDVEFEADGVTLKNGLPPLTDQVLDASGTVNFTPGPVGGTLGGGNPLGMGLDADWIDNIEIDVPVKFNFDLLAGAEGHMPAGAMPELGMARITADSFIAPDTPQKVAEVSAETLTKIDETTKTFGEKVAGMVADGTLDPATINDNFLIPLTDYWNTTFGAGGALTTTSKAFATAFTTEMTKVGTGVTEMVVKINEQLTILNDSLTLKKDEVAQTLNGLNTAATDPLNTFSTNMQTAMGSAAMSVNLVTAALGALIIAVGIASTLTLPTLGGSGGGTGVDGSHAGGLTTVPYNGYIAELHKDEMVLTARQADQYRMGAAVGSSKTNNRTDNSTTVVNINGVQDVNGVVKELKRRGVKIG